MGFIGIAASNWDTCEDAMDWEGAGIDVVAKAVTYPLPPVASDFAAKGLSYALRTTPNTSEEERAFRQESWRRAQGTWR